jgi:uncharacterized protein YciI
MAYMITCLVDPRRESAGAALKPDHLRYVGSRKREIVFGGVVEAPDGSPQRVVYFVEASTEAEAWAFVRGDPYTALYETISVVAFQQIPPRPSPRTVVDPFDFPGDLAAVPQ